MESIKKKTNIIDAAVSYLDATLNEYVEQNVHVMHPTDDDKYVHISDVKNKNDFNKKWEKEPNHSQNHFGWDSPIHNDPKKGFIK